MKLLDFFYKQYSKIPPILGKLVAGSKQPYKYLIDSIEKFYNQKSIN